MSSGHIHTVSSPEIVVVPSTQVISGATVSTSHNNNYLNCINLLHSIKMMGRAVMLHAYNSLTVYVVREPLQKPAY